MTLDQDNGWTKPVHTGVLVLATGEVIEGYGLGAVGEATGEVCFNTAMTGYQEILTDPSYAAQIVTFTFPHIGNVGVNGEDIETVDMEKSAGAVGAIFGQPVTEPSNFRAEASFSDWLARRGVVALYGVDTRALTALIRERGMPNAVIAHSPDGKFDIAALKAKAAQWPGIDGMDLVPGVGAREGYEWRETRWRLGAGYGARDGAAKYRVVAIDYGVKRNILRLLAAEGCEVIVAPATASSAEILALAPDGVFLSNGPGDPAETGK
jgi:carbamoyl-phosphate synthase small subunit